MKGMVQNSYSGGTENRTKNSNEVFY